jgi:hypothetical protein
MMAENLAKYRADPHIAFWKNLKEGSDQGDPSTVAAVVAKQGRGERGVADLVTQGKLAIRLVYDDGGGHQSFREFAMAASGASAYAALDDRTRRSLGDVSRPDALAAGPREIPIEVAAAKRPKAAGSAPATPTAGTATMVASAAVEPATPASPSRSKPGNSGSHGSGQGASLSSSPSRTTSGCRG